MTPNFRIDDLTLQDYLTVKLLSVTSYISALNNQWITKIITPMTQNNRMCIPSEVPQALLNLKSRLSYTTGVAAKCLYADVTSIDMAKRMYDELLFQSAKFILEDVLVSYGNYYHHSNNLRSIVGIRRIKSNNVIYFSNMSRLTPLVHCYSQNPNYAH